MPIVPIMKIGPELLLKQSILCASDLLILFSLYRSQVNLAPRGYPDNIPQTMGKAPFPLILKILLKMGLNFLLR